MSVVDVVYLDNKDGRPENKYPVRNAGILPVKGLFISSSMAKGVIPPNREYDYPIHTILTKESVEEGNGILKVYSQEEEEQLLSSMKEIKQREIKDFYENSVLVLEEGYPVSEIKSWFVQVKEAEEYLATGTQGNWITNAAKVKGCTVDELVQWILEMSSSYSQVHSIYTAHRQILRDAIENATGFEELLEIRWDNDILQKHME